MKRGIVIMLLEYEVRGVLKKIYIDIWYLWEFWEKYTSREMFEEEEIFNLGKDIWENYNIVWKEYDLRFLKNRWKR